MNRMEILGIFALSILGSVILPVRSLKHYRVTVLPSVKGAPNTYVAALNDRGGVVGSSYWIGASGKQLN